MDAVPSSLILMRHGAAQVPAGCCVGQLDVGLQKQSIAAIVELAKGWSLPLPRRIVCSDLERARHSAELIANELAMDVEQDPRLREIGLGEWEGAHWDEIYQRDPGFMDRWGEGWLDLAPAGGETGRQMIARVALALAELPAGSLVVAHAGPLAAIHCLRYSIEPARLFEFSFEYATPVMVD